MPSFDIVSEVEQQEVTNALDQANREIQNRFDFKGSNAKFELGQDTQIQMTAPNEFQLKQMIDILKTKMAKREIDIKCLTFQTPQHNLNESKQSVDIKQGLDGPLTKKIIKQIKDKKLKVQTSAQGDKVRVTGKKRDDLQEVIAMLKEAEIEVPLQYNNFRD